MLFTLIVIGSYPLGTSIIQPANMTLLSCFSCTHIIHTFAKVVANSC